MMAPIISLTVFFFQGFKFLRERESDWHHLGHIFTLLVGTSHRKERSGFLLKTSMLLPKEKGCRQAKTTACMPH
jgi:hypothetical protein